MSSSIAIANYESLATLTAQMIKAARQGEWDVLTMLEQQRSKLVTDMKAVDIATQLDPANRQRKIALIENVMAQDAEIRTLVQAWMNEYELSMQSNAQELRLLRKYGA